MNPRVGLWALGLSLLCWALLLVPVAVAAKPRCKHQQSPRCVAKRLQYHNLMKRHERLLNEEWLRSQEQPKTYGGLDEYLEEHPPEVHEQPVPGGWYLDPTHECESYYDSNCADAYGNYRPWRGCEGPDDWPCWDQALGLPRVVPSEL